MDHTNRVENTKKAKWLVLNQPSEAQVALTYHHKPRNYWMNNTPQNTLEFESQGIRSEKKEQKREDSNASQQMSKVLGFSLFRY
jgi:hypothetical protein